MSRENLKTFHMLSAEKYNIYFLIIIIHLDELCRMLTSSQDIMEHKILRNTEIYWESKIPSVNIKFCF